MKQLPEAYQEVERFCKVKGLKVAERGTTPYGEFFIAETDKEFENAKLFDYPAGFFQVCWFFASSASKGKLDLARWLEFDGMHDLELSEKDRREARLEAARRDCEYYLKLNVEAGRYN